MEKIKTYTELTSSNRLGHVRENYGIKSRDMKFCYVMTGYNDFTKRLLKIMRIITNQLSSLKPYLNHYKRSIKIEPWLRTRLRSFSIPQVEHKIRSIVEKCYPKYKNKLPKEVSIKYEDILKQDYSIVDRYAEVKNVTFKNPEHLLFILNYFYDHFKNQGLDSKNYQVLTFDEALEHIPKDTSSCYPVFEKKNHPKAIDEAHNFIKELYNRKKYLSAYNLFIKYPAFIFHRFQNRLKGPDNLLMLTSKIRLIFGISFGIVVFETMIFQNLIDFLVKNFSCMGIGLTRLQISRKVGRIREIAIENDKLVYCIDIKGIDRNLAASWIIIFFSFMVTVISLNPINFTLVVALSLYHVITPILSSRLDLVYSFGGNKSGSKLTALLNTFVVIVVINLFILETENRIPDFDEYSVTGDDGLFLVKKEHFSKVKHFFSSHSITLNVDKSIICDPFVDNLEYLGFKWDTFGQPNQDDKWWISRVVYPERFVEEQGYGRIIIRIASICYQFVGGDLITKKLLGKIGIDYYLLYSADPVIYYLDRTRRTHLGRIPFSKLDRLKWTAF